MSRPQLTTMKLRIWEVSEGGMSQERLLRCPGSGQNKVNSCSSQEGAWLGQQRLYHIIARCGRRETLQGEIPFSGTERWGNTSSEAKVAVWRRQSQARGSRQGGVAAVRLSSMVSTLESPALSYTFVIVAVTVLFLIAVSSKLFSAPDLCLLCFQFSSPSSHRERERGRKWGSKKDAHGLETLSGHSFAE